MNLRQTQSCRKCIKPSHEIEMKVELENTIIEKVVQTLTFFVFLRV